MNVNWCVEVTEPWACSRHGPLRLLFAIGLESHPLGRFLPENFLKEDEHNTKADALKFKLIKKISITTESSHKGWAPWKARSPYPPQVHSTDYGYSPRACKAAATRPTPRM